MHRREKKRKKIYTYKYIHIWCFDEELRNLGAMNLISGTEERKWKKKVNKDTICMYVQETGYSLRNKERTESRETVFSRKEVGE